MRISDKWTEIVLSGMKCDLDKNVKHRIVLQKLLEGVRFFLICGGVRSGKSFITAVMGALLSEPTDSSIEDSEPDLGWIIGPDYNQTRQEFLYILDLFDRAGWVKSKTTPENITSPWAFETTWNFRWETKTSNDMRKLASRPPRVVLVPEAAQQSYEVWLKSRERSTEKRGWVIMNGTLEEGQVWYGDMLQRWKAPNKENGFSISIATWDNRIKYPLGYDDPEIQLLKQTFPEDVFDERFAAEPRKSTGLVIPEFDFATHVRELTPDPEIPVELWIDPGKNAYCVLFVQVVGLRVLVLDRVYRRNALAQDVIPEAMANSLWPLVKKNNGTHGVIDIAGKHEYGLPSHVEVWRNDAEINLRTNYVHQEDSRNVVRYRLKAIDEQDRQPLLLFDAKIGSDVAYDGQAADLLAEFGLWKWREPRAGSSEPRQPIDANNHGIKALGYGLYDKYGPIYQRPKMKPARQRGYWH